MTGSRRVLLGAVSNWARFFVSAGVSIVLVPLMAKSFGAERYGLWTLSSSILGFLQSLDAGFGAGTVKWTAEARGPEDAARRDELLSTSLAVHLVAALAASSIVIAISLLFGRLFSIPAPLLPESGGLFLLLGIRVAAVGIPAGFLRGLVFGSDRLLVLNFLQIASTVLYGLAAWALLASGTGTLGLAAAGLALAALETGAIWLVARNAMRASKPAIRLSPRSVTRARFAEAFSYSGSSFMVQVASAILLQSDLIMLKFFAPLAVVAGYGVAQRAADYGLMMVKQVVNALTPSIARLDPAAEPAKARFFMANASKYAGALAAILTVSCWTLGSGLLAAWAGPEYGEYGIVLGILMTAFLFIAVQMPCAAFLSLKGDHVWSARAMVASAAINIVASLLLAVLFGHIGIALGTLVSSVTVDGVALPLRAYRKVGMRAGDLLRRVWLRVLAPAAVQAAVIIAARRLVPGDSIASIIALGLIGTGVYLALFVPFSLDASERRLFLGGKERRR